VNLAKTPLSAFRKNKKDDMVVIGGDSSRFDYGT
jgi:hypothetical protein